MAYDLITILGPTACGKTALAVSLAACLDTEIISGDSRQVYKKMDIGTGKDLDEYVFNGKKIPYHLIDIAEPGSKYTLFNFQHDFLEAYNSIKKQGKIPVFCGGSGLYLESVLRSYNLSPVPVNQELRENLEKKTLGELAELLSSFRPLHNTTDTDTKKRAIRAIEIELYYMEHTAYLRAFPSINSLVIGVDVDRQTRRQRITERLCFRLKNGMIDEIRDLLDSGIPAENLIYYGLEYKYVTQYVIGMLTYDEMFSHLQIAIHQFAKRQMTWFRGMERRGISIHWIDNNLPMDGKVAEIMYLLEKN